MNRLTSKIPKQYFSADGILANYINGKFVPATNATSQIELIHSGSNEGYGRYFEATAADVESAVDCSRAAQAAWKSRTGTERGRVLRNAVDLLVERNDELAMLEAIDTGRPIQETLVVDVVSAKDCMEYYSGLASSFGGQFLNMPDNSFAYTKREPLGVTAGIGAFNYPIQGCAWKAAPSLALGNSMIFKPADDTPLTALAFAELLTDAGLPAGLFNVVLGGGATGSLLSKHQDVAKVSFTGSVATGKLICKDAANSLKKVTMELGGKSPLIVYDDCDVDQAVSAAMLGNWYSNGEVCSNCTRLLVQDKVFDEFLAKFVSRTSKLVIGDPLDQASQIGAMINRAHMRKLQSFVQSGLDEGAKLVYGGQRFYPEDQSLSEGCYLTPAIFTECDDSMRIVREEHFGMLACVLKFDSDEEAIRRANDTVFGLAAGVFTRNLKRAHRTIDQLDAGVCYVNTYNLAPVELPWGGFKQSGIGSENGLNTINHWSKLKSVYVEMNDLDCPYE